MSVRLEKINIDGNLFFFFEMEKSPSPKNKSARLVSLILSKSMPLFIPKKATNMVCFVVQVTDVGDLWIYQSGVTCKGLPMSPTSEPEKTKKRKGCALP